MQVIQTSEILKTAWEMTKRNFGFLWGVLIILFLVNVFFRLSTKLLLGAETPLGLIISLVSILGLIISLVTILVRMFLQIGVLQILLRLSENKKAEFGQMLHGSRFFWRFILGTLLMVFIVFAGLILFIIPGIIWAIKYSQWKFLLLDKDLGVIESFKKSAEITQGSKMDMLVVGLAMFGILVVSVIPLGLGLIATIPLSKVVPALIYKKLKDSKEGTPVHEETSGAEHTNAETLTPFAPLS